MNRLTKLRLGMLVAIGGAISAQALSFTLAKHELELDFETLKDPSTYGVSLKVAPKETSEENPLAVNFDGLIALEENLGERANGSLSYNKDWRCPGEEITADNMPSQPRMYHGRVGVDLGFESGRVKDDDGKPGDWEASNVKVGLVLNQHVPYSRIKLPWVDQEGWPLVVGASIHYIEAVDGPQESGARYGVLVDWVLCVFSVPAASAFIGARGEWYWIDNDDDKNYAEARAQLSIPAFRLVEEMGDPLLFVKYVNGAQPPSFEDRDEWNFGVGTKWEW